MFGEERYILIHQYEIKNPVQPKLPDEEPVKEGHNFVAPYTIQCLSTEVEILKISGVEFTKKCLKEKITEDIFIQNLKKKQSLSRFKEKSWLGDIKTSNEMKK